MKFKGACLPSLSLMGELDKFANGPYINILAWLRGFRVKIVNFFKVSFVS